VKVLTTEQTFRDITEFLTLEESFAFMRFGDGDLLVMDGGFDSYHAHSFMLEKELKEAFTMPETMVMKALGSGYATEEGMVPGLFAPHKNDQHLNDLVDKFAHPADVKWYNAVTFHYYTVFKTREMKFLLNEYIRPRKKMFIGSVQQKDAERFFGKIHHYIRVPERDAYDTIDDWWPEIAEKLTPISPLLILPAAGLASRVVTKRIWEAVYGYGPTVLDFGSIADAAAHKPTRTWIKVVDKAIDNVLL